MNSSKIAVIGNSWFPNKPGGLDRYVYELVHELTAEDQVNLFGVDLPAQSAIPHLNFTTVAQPTTPLLSRLVAACARARTPHLRQADAVNIHFALYGLAALPYLPKGIPVTCHFHGPWAIESQREGDSALKVWLKRQVEQRVYRRCDRFIVLSKAFGTILHQEYQVPWHKIHIIPGGVDTSRFTWDRSRQEARQALGWPRDRFILFTPRRLVHRVGLDVLLEAMAQLDPAHPLWLAIAGKGPLREALEAKAAALGLGDRVKFLGFLPDADLPTAYQAADLAVMPSQSLEGFGLVLLEALASGTPALCTPVGGMPEVIAPFSPALVTASPRAEAIATALDAALTGGTALPERAACRQYAVDHFSWPVIAERVRQVLLAH